MDHDRSRSDRRMRPVIAFLATALVAGSFALSTAKADALFSSAGHEPPRPWFGETVDRLYEQAREDYLSPALAASRRFLDNTDISGWVDETYTRAKALVDAGVDGLAPTRVGPNVAATASGSIEGSARPPSSQIAGLKMAAAPAIPDHIGPSDFESSDPLEPFNRTMFALNNALRRGVFDPASDLYRRRASPAVQTGVHNFFGNLREPVTITSNLLEGKLGDAGNATARLGINTVLGLAGVYDRAADMGYPPQPRNLEQTLCAYRLPSGPYLVLPVLGPATLRDSVGRLATAVAYYEVMGLGVYVPYRLTDIALQYSDVREKARFIDTLSIDPYLAQKSAYLATRTLSCGGQALADKEFFTK